MTITKTNKGRVFVDLFENIADLESIAAARGVEVSELAKLLLLDGIGRLKSNLVPTKTSPKPLAVSSVGVLDDPDYRPCKAHAENLNTLTQIFGDSAVCLLEVTLKATGERVAAICGTTESEGQNDLVPFAIMLNGNPYELLDPPV